MHLRGASIQPLSQPLACAEDDGKVLRIIREKRATCRNDGTSVIASFHFELRQFPGNRPIETACLILM